MRQKRESAGLVQTQDDNIGDTAFKTMSGGNAK
jgi:hypothetical protein